MFFVGKKTTYLSLCENGQKGKTVGFAQITGTQNGMSVLLKIKEAETVLDGIYPVWLLAEEKGIEIGKIVIKKGTGSFENRNILPCILPGIRVYINTQTEILGGVSKGYSMMKANISALPMKVQEDSRVERKTFADKWEGLQKRFEVVHPFGDNRIFLKLTIDDLIILTDQCKKIVNNSFLLHGYYNYRHLILGKDCRLRECGKECFYLGVPGVYYEREKQVAVMFGFEGFESADCIEFGKFGYYMREVEIC